MDKANLMMLQNMVAGQALFSLHSEDATPEIEVVKHCITLLGKAGNLPQERTASLLALIEEAKQAVAPDHTRLEDRAMIIKELAEKEGLFIHGRRLDRLDMVKAMFETAVILDDFIERNILFITANRLLDTQNRIEHLGGKNMFDNQIRGAFEQRINENYQQKLTGWRQLSPDELIERAEEIFAVRLIHKHLPSQAAPEDMEYLLRFADPLSVVSDHWQDDFGLDAVYDDDLSQVLWAITSTDSSEMNYELTDEFCAGQAPLEPQF